MSHQVSAWDSADGLKAVIPERRDAARVFLNTGDMYARIDRDRVFDGEGNVCRWVWHIEVFGEGGHSIAEIYNADYDAALAAAVLAVQSA